MRRVLVLVPGARTAAGLEVRSGEIEGCSFGEDISFEFRQAKIAPAMWDNWHDLAIADLSLFEIGLDAQEEGYSAVCIETLSDGGVNALRSLLDIPVVGPGRLSYLTALMLGDRFSILHVCDGWRLLSERALKEYGLTDRCASIRSIDVEPNFEDQFGGREAECYPRLVEVAQECIADGAEVIVLGSTTMYRAHPYVAERLPIPVINPAPLMFKLVEDLLDLGLTHSRATYAKAGFPKRDMLHAMVDAVSDFPAG